MNYRHFILILSLIFSVSVFASTPLPTSGNLKLSNVSPAWHNYGDFGTLGMVSDSFSRTFTFNSTVNQTIVDTPTISGDSKFAIATSSCVSGFNFTTSNNCTIKVSFTNNYYGNGVYNATLNFAGFSIPLIGVINLNSPLLTLTDNNYHIISTVNFNTMFESENNIQTRTFVLKDKNKSLMSLPNISLTGSNFSLSQSCTIEQINSDSGCIISVSFNSQNKSVQTYNDTISIGTQSLNVIADVLSLASKGSVPSYFITTSNGDIITTQSLGSQTKNKNSSYTAYLYLRDANRLINSQINYAKTGDTQFSSYYSSCSASNLKGSNGCTLRFNFTPYNQPVGNYNANITGESFSLSLTGTVVDTTPYSQSPLYVITDASGGIQDSLLVGNANPGSSSVITNWYFKDINKSTWPTTTGFNFSGLSGVLNFSYNQCSGGSSQVNTDTGCLIKVSGLFNQSPGTYSQILTNSFTGFNIPVKLNILGNTCSPNSSQSCVVTNGTGTETCNESGTSFGSCVMNSCNEEYHNESGLCISDIRSCEIENGSGVQLWIVNQWSSQCQVSDCNSNYHVENNNCLPNVSNVAIAHGSARGGWNGINYSTSPNAPDISCNNGYHAEYGSCIGNIKDITYSGTNQYYKVYRPDLSDPINHIYVYTNWGLCDTNVSWQDDNGMCHNLSNEALYSGLISLEGNVPDCNGNSSFTFDHYDSVQGVTFCRLNSLSHNTLLLPGNISCPSNYNKISYDSTNGVSVCQTVSCQPYYESQNYNLYTNGSTVTTVRQDLTQPSNLTLMGSCSATCNSSGTGYGDCQVNKCNENGGYFWNRLTGTCEPGLKISQSVVVGINSTLNDSKYVHVYQNSTNKKYYYHINDPSFFVESLKFGASDSFCTSVNFGSDTPSNNFLDVECSYASPSPNGSILSDLLTRVKPLSSNPYYGYNRTLYNSNNSVKVQRTKKNSPTSSVSNGLTTTTFSFSTTQWDTNWIHSCNYGQFPFKQFITNTNTNPDCTSSLRQCNPVFSKIVATSSTESQILTCNGSTYSVNTIASGICLGNYHMENGICVDNIKQCGVGDSIPGGATVAYKYWTGSSYSSCIADTYNCGSNSHPESQVDIVSCVSNSKSCSINQGLGTSYWDNVNGWSSCVISSCQANFHLETIQGITSCQSNSKSCLDQNIIPLADGALQTWDNNLQNYGPCLANHCVSSAHLSNGACDLNVVSCVGSISNSLLSGV